MKERVPRLWHRRQDEAPARERFANVDREPPDESRNHQIADECESDALIRRWRSRQWPQRKVRRSKQIDENTVRDERDPHLVPLPALPRNSQIVHRNGNDAGKQQCEIAPRAF
jgi:hypothetical protein